MTCPFLVKIRQVHINFRATSVLFAYAVYMCPTSAAYLQYADAIRKEYSHVPDIEYCDRRARVSLLLISKDS